MKICAFNLIWQYYEVDFLRIVAKNYTHESCSSIHTCINDCSINIYQAWPGPDQYEPSPHLAWRSNTFEETEVDQGPG